MEAKKLSPIGEAIANAMAANLGSAATPETLDAYDREKDEHSRTYFYPICGTGKPPPTIKDGVAVEADDSEKSLADPSGE